MTATLSRIGLISYADDPERTVFRVVLLEEADPDSELDNPRWVVEGIDPARPVQMDKVGVALGKGQVAVGEKVFNLGDGFEQFAPEVALVVETAVVQPSEKVWQAPQDLVDAMARLSTQQKAP